MKKNTGFTLMEMMVVIAMLGVMSGVAIPNLMALLPGMRLNGAARQVMGDLMATRMSAVKENNDYKFSFLSNHTYQILDDDDNDGVADTGEALTTTDIRTEYAGVTFTWTGNPTFHPRGTTTDAPVITIQNQEGTCREVDVSISGQVKIGECGS